MSLILTNADFLDYHDWRWVGKNMLDTNPGTAAQLADLLDPNTPAGARLNRFITAAEEMMFAAVIVADRYTVQQVIQYGGELAKMIVAGLAVGPVLGRRDRAVSDQSKLSLTYDQAFDYIEQLRRGERIFYAVPKVPEAGLPGPQSLTPRPGIDPPRITDAAGRYFGTGPIADWPAGSCRYGGFA